MRLVLHEDPVSGNCYKIRLTAALLGLPLERVAYDITRGETRTPQFLAAVNANGRIPVLQVGDRMLPESNAACWYLADGSALLPHDRFDRADVLRWLLWEQYNHEPNIATLRFWLRVTGEDALSDLQRLQIAPKRAGGAVALALMEAEFSARDWLVGGAVTIADLALYAYTHVAGDAGFDLADHPAVQRWIARIEALPGFVPLHVPPPG
ncbi:glutathione S-transferase family protein [Parablastomonas sp. CN1-191]|uniref:glutathione S-transferase family protein n=1 Tax=Parablastomonas sp. CN1-191 TaxID=3400908 RepID=UPI003BF81C68